MTVPEPHSSVAWKAQRQKIPLRLRLRQTVTAARPAYLPSVWTFSHR